MHEANINREFAVICAIMARRVEWICLCAIGLVRQGRHMQNVYFIRLTKRKPMCSLSNSVGRCQMQEQDNLRAHSPNQISSSNSGWQPI